MSKGPQTSGKRFPWIRWGLIAVAGLLIYQTLAGPRGLLKLADLRAQKREAQVQLDSLEARKRELEAEKQRLLTDTAYLEKLARKELGMARPGERVYRFVAPRASGDTSRGR